VILMVIELEHWMGWQSEHGMDSRKEFVELEHWTESEWESEMDYGKGGY